MYALRSLRPLGALAIVYPTSANIILSKCMSLFKLLVRPARNRTDQERQLRVDSGGSDADARRPEGDKIMRLHAQTATIENGLVWLPEEAPWLADFAAFPRGRHDDQVDSTAQAPAWTKLHLSQSIIGPICTAIKAIRLCNGARRAPLLAYVIPCA